MVEKFLNLQTVQKQVFMPLEKSLHFRILSLNEVRRATRNEKRVQAAKSEFQILCEKSIFPMPKCIAPR